MKVQRTLTAAGGPPTEFDYGPLLPMEQESSAVSLVPVQRLLSFLLRYWWVPLLTLVLSLGAAGAYAWFQTPVYVSTATMYMPPQIQMEGLRFSQDIANFFGTQAELLKNPRLQQQAIDAMRTSGANTVPKGGDGQVLPVKINVTQTPKSTVFDVVAIGPEPEYTRAFLDAVINQYLVYQRESHKGNAGGVIASISRQVNTLEAELKEKQAALDAFERTNNLAVLEEDSKAAGGQLAQKKADLSNLLLEQKLLLETQEDQKQALSSATNNNFDTLTAMHAIIPSLAGGSIMGAERLSTSRQLELLKAQRDRLARYLRVKHPKMVKLKTDIDSAERLIEMYRRQSGEQLAASLHAVDMKTQNVQEGIREWEAKVTLSSRRIADAETLRREVSRTQARYDHVVVLMNQVEMGSSIEQEMLTILDPASPAVHTHRQQILLLLVAGFLGLGFGLCIVLLVAVRDDRFNSLAEVKQQLSERVVGQVPEVSMTDAQGRVPLLRIEDRRQTFAESYRNLRSALLFLTPLQDEHPRILLVTSAMQDEGKSTVASNLARALAMGGARVLLIDADMRRGALHEILGLDRTPGLTEVLRQPSLLPRCIQCEANAPRQSARRQRMVGEAPTTDFESGQPDLLPNLFFLSRGSDAANPGDLLLNPALDQIFARLRKQYDYVLIDTCPVFAADDATTLAPKVDGTLLVVRSRFSRSGQVREALELLYERQARVLGLVFNRTDAKARSYYYYTNAHYHVAVESPR